MFTPFFLVCDRGLLVLPITAEKKITHRTVKTELAPLKFSCRYGQVSSQFASDSHGGASELWGIQND